MADLRSSSFAIPLMVGGVLLAALFLALFPTVPSPCIPVSRCGIFLADDPPHSRVSLLERWRLEREQRQFLERLLERLEDKTETYVRCCERIHGCLGSGELPPGASVLKDNDPPDLDPDVDVDARCDGAGVEIDEPVRVVDPRASY